MTSLSTKRFEKIYRLTKAFCNIDPSINYDSIVQKKLERWKVLVDIWDANKKKFRYNVFKEPIYYVFYGRISAIPSKKVVALQVEIVDALINDEDAFYVWSQTQRFHYAFRTVMENIIKPKTGYLHTCYVCSRGLHRLFCDRKVSDKAKLLLHKYTGKNVSELESYRNDFACVRPMLEELFPQMCTWSDKECCSISAICKACNDMYGTNLYYRADEYEPIFKLQDYKHGDRVEYPVYINAKLNYKVANAVLGQDTDAVLNDIFQDAYNNLNASPGQGQLINSWIFDIVNTWAHDKTHPYHNLVKRPVFDVYMRAI